VTRIRYLRHLAPVLAGLLVSLGAVAVSAAQVRSASPAAYRQPKPSLFGINTGTYVAQPSAYVKDFALDRQLGGRWDHMTGNAIKWEQGRLDWKSLDTFVKLSQEQGLGMMISLAGDPNPKACSIHPVPSNPTRCHPVTASDFRMYKAFLRQELVRYRHDVTYYESWVEPNHTGQWPPHPNPAQYAALLKAQYSVFQSVDKKYHVHLKLMFGGSADFTIAPGSSGGIAVLPFVHSVLEDLKGQRAFDLIAVHGYRFPPATYSPAAEAQDDVQGIPDASGSSGPYPKQGCGSTLGNSGVYCKMTWKQELSAYEQEFINRGYGSEQLWVTEFGWPGVSKVPPHPDPSAAYYPLYKAQKRDLQQAYQVLFHLPFVKAAFWFNIRDYAPGVPNPDPPFFAHFGLLTANGSKKPAALAFKALAHEYSGR
jgi:hypothetical protein